MSEAPEPSARRPARWLAFLLNLVFAPAGYIYIGALRWAFGWVVAGIVLALIGMAWTVNAPPGLYLAVAPGVRLIDLALLINLLLALHVIWLASKPRRRLALWPAIGLGLLFWLVPLALGNLLRAFAPGAIYTAASASMQPTLEEGDLLLSSGDRTLCGDIGIRPGDVIFSRQRGAIYSHRAVAGPGQTVALVNGRLIIDGRPVAVEVIGRQTTRFGVAEVVRETLADGRSYLTLDAGPGAPFDNLAPMTVPAGHWFTLGDNRDNAMDSRADGPVAAAQICGVAVRILQASDPAKVGARP